MEAKTFGVAVAAVALGFLTACTVAAGEHSSWQRSHVRVLSTGDPEWAREPFVLEAGDSARYIDYAGGDNRNDGLSRRTPWDHHPRGAKVTSNAAVDDGIHMYVLRQGVDYRSVLLAEAAPEEIGPETLRTTHFVLAKKGSLISRPSGMPKPGPNYICLVEMSKLKDFPHDYALYYSTDHAQRGGIWLSVCTGDPTNPRNWKSYDQAVVDGDFDYLEEKPKANPIFVDTTQGRQTETPYANVIGETVYMTYHNSGAGHNQSTLLATSKDGVNFKRLNGRDDSVILDYAPGKDVGDGHTGYFRWGPNPFLGIDYEYVGYSLHGGGRNYHSAIWGSNDAVQWNKLEVLAPIEGHAIEDGRLIIWHKIDPRSITRLANGEYIAICTGGTRSSGAGSRVHELYEIFLADDGRSLTRRSRKILANGPAGSDDQDVLSHPTSVVAGDTWRLLYVGSKGKAKVHTIMAASGELNKNAPKSQKLKDSEQKRHFHAR